MRKVKQAHKMPLTTFHSCLCSCSFFLFSSHGLEGHSLTPLVMDVKRPKKTYSKKCSAKIQMRFAKRFPFRYKILSPLVSPRLHPGPQNTEEMKLEAETEVHGALKKPCALKEKF